MNYVNRLAIASILIIGTSGCHSLQPTDLSSAPAQPVTAAIATDTSTPDTAEVQIGLGRMYEKQGSHQAAMKAYTAALRHTSDHPDAHWRLGVIYDELGDFSSAEQSFRKSLAANPGNADCLCDYGYSLYLQTRWQDAEDALLKALAIDRYHRRSHNILGIIKTRQNLLREAHQHFQQAGCTNAECEENIAFAMILDNRLEQARNHYERALRLNPQSTKSQKNLDLLSTEIAKHSPSKSMP